MDMQMDFINKIEELFPQFETSYVDFDTRHEQGYKDRPLEIAVLTLTHITSETNQEVISFRITTSKDGLSDMDVQIYITRNDVVARRFKVDIYDLTQNRLIPEAYKLIQHSIVWYNKVEELDRLIQEGIDSGPAVPWNVEEFVAKMESKNG